MRAEGKGQGTSNPFFLCRLFCKQLRRSLILFIFLQRLQNNSEMFGKGKTPVKNTRLHPQSRVSRFHLSRVFMFSLRACVCVRALATLLKKEAAVTGQWSSLLLLFILFFTVGHGNRSVSAFSSPELYLSQHYRRTLARIKKTVASPPPSIQLWKEFNNSLFHKKKLQRRMGSGTSHGFWRCWSKSWLQNLGWGDIIKTIE